MNHPVHREGKLVGVDQRACGDDDQEDEVGIYKLLPRREQRAQRHARVLAQRAKRDGEDDAEADEGDRAVVRRAQAVGGGVGEVAEDVQVPVAARADRELEHDERYQRYCFRHEVECEFRTHFLPVLQHIDFGSEFGNVPDLALVVGGGSGGLGGEVEPKIGEPQGVEGKDDQHADELQHETLPAHRVREKKQGPETRSVQVDEEIL